MTIYALELVETRLSELNVYQGVHESFGTSFFVKEKCDLISVRGIKIGSSLSFPSVVLFYCAFF